MEFEEEYNHRRTVCGYGGSYEYHVIWYDEKKKEFYVDDSHYGSVDVEEFFDGTRQLDAFAVLKAMIEHNHLKVALKYRAEVHLERDLNKVLAQMEQHMWRAPRGFLTDPHFQYYRINEEEYAAYSNGTYFSGKENGEMAVDFSVVRRIFENHQTVICYGYDWSLRKWIPSPLEKAAQQ